MEYTIHRTEELKDTLFRVLPGDTLLMPRKVYYAVSSQIKLHQKAICCTDQYCEIPNLFPNPESMGVSILFRHRQKVLKELVYTDFVGRWKRKDTGAIYNFERSTGLATKSGVSKPFDYKLEHKSDGSIMEINRKRFELLDFKPSKFTILMQGEKIIFEKVMNQ